ncbi:Alpha-1,2-mannosyltransferase [Wickerhamomyces ciferrii]|uniref:Alpha-1,2-mannosyltransferase n=1 Tax=Wickerhamomyces ciferrii (strain ATCC 14091 / BCRC 22168 / CBS 111 / JCM 3599 / NBRC 0793 / NRRL Y-1031 F-60-10) TaxID=1206466 RepID=K0K8T5_WICCF|nr:Alpha-1,2-mannosyltransferase [Wickerhamomyces ciferrii]CCH41255.1 Alpha-1,2-mannosyltransferase [Wickerhamomyces ciferrii]
MSFASSFGSLSTRKNVLRILVAVVVFQLIFNYLLPERVSSPLNKPSFEESISTPSKSESQGIPADGEVHIPVLGGPEPPFDPTEQLSKIGSEEKLNGLSNTLKEKIKADVDSKIPEKLSDINNDKSLSKLESGSSSSSSESKQLKEERSFFKKAVDIFIRNKPEGIDNVELNEQAPSYWYIDLPNPTFTIDFLKKFTKMSDEQLNELKKKHSSLKLDILDLEYPKGTFEGKGIVMVAGGPFLSTALISIRALRETGSKLPLQLMLTTSEEYDKDVCEELLPKLNAKCMIMEEIVGKETFQSLKLQKYELKVLGLFLSTFEEVLLMDADNLAVKDPDYILDSKPFKEFGYIIWPDFWRQTISPYFYDITGVEVGEPIRKDGVNPEGPNNIRSESQLSDLEGTIPDSTCEAGQLAISKKLHHKSLLATVYYNLFGFKFYYHLLGQGAVGIGDKDTFIAGLTVFKESYYFMKQRPLLFGYDHKDGWQDTTMVQYDPEQDYEYYQAAKQYLIKEGIDSRINLFLNHEYTGNLRKKIDESINKPKPEVQFLHIHYPKFNAKKNFENGDYEVNGHERRQFGPREKIKNDLELDWELKISRISQWLACDSKIVPEDWKVENKQQFCDRLKKHVDWLIETSDTPEMAQLKELGV